MFVNYGCKSTLKIIFKHKLFFIFVSKKIFLSQLLDINFLFELKTTFLKLILLRGSTPPQISKKIIENT